VFYDVNSDVVTCTGDSNSVADELLTASFGLERYNNIMISISLVALRIYRYSFIGDLYRAHKCRKFSLDDKSFHMMMGIGTTRAASISRIYLHTDMSSLFL